MRIQPRSSKPRVPAYSSVTPEIEEAVTYTANLFKVSKSWVRAVAMAEFFGIDVPHYNTATNKRKVVNIGARRRRRA